MFGLHISGRSGWMEYTDIPGGYLAFGQDGMPHGRIAMFRTCWDCLGDAVVKFWSLQC